MYSGTRWREMSNKIKEKGTHSWNSDVEKSPEAQNGEACVSFGHASRLQTQMSLKLEALRLSDTLADGSLHPVTSRYLKFPNPWWEG